MAAVTFAEAARRLGHRSRSTLYRLKADHRLNHYLVDGPDGSTLLELTPEGRPTLEAYLAAVLEPGRGPQTRRREQRSQRDRRWELVAANLSAALEEIGGPSLTGKEAELLVLHMGPATWEVFPHGLPEKDAKDPDWIDQNLWTPLAAEANQWLVEDGWRFPRLTGLDVLRVYRAADQWMEETTWDTESQAWWEEAMADREPDDPDPWRCEWCGKPWHHSHPEFEPTPEAMARREALLIRLGMSRGAQDEETSTDVSGHLGGPSTQGI